VPVPVFVSAIVRVGARARARAGVRVRRSWHRILPAALAHCPAPPRPGSDGLRRRRGPM